MIVNYEHKTEERGKERKRAREKEERKRGRKKERGEINGRERDFLKRVFPVHCISRPLLKCIRTIALEG